MRRLFGHLVDKSTEARSWQLCFLEVVCMWRPLEGSPAEYHHHTVAAVEMSRLGIDHKAAHHTVAAEGLADIVPAAVEDVVHIGPIEVK